jgi:uncharacterized membrane protein
MSDVRLYRQFGYVDAYGIFGAQWLSKNVDARYTQIYADIYARMNELRGYGMIYMGYVDDRLSNTTELKGNGIVYLSKANVIGGTVVSVRVWNTSELDFLNDLNKIYSNGGSEVYKNRP